jgi:hypothetical protein
MRVSRHRILQWPGKRRSQPETSHERVGNEGVVWGVEETEKGKEQEKTTSDHWSKGAFGTNADAILDSSSGLYGIARPLFLVLPPRRPVLPTWVG